MVDLIANLEHIAGILNPKDISLFLKFISAKILNDAPAIKPYELDLILSLANSNTKTEDADQMKVIQSDALELLWSYLFNSHSDDYLDFQNVNKTLLSLSTLLKKADIEIVKGYFEKIFANLKDNPNYLQLKLVAQFFKERTFTALNTRKNLVDELE